MASCAKIRRGLDAEFSEHLIKKIANGLFILCDVLNTRAVILKQLKFTFCNAADSRRGISFSKARCSAKESNRTFMLGDIFDRGVDILLHFIQNQKVPDTCTTEEKYVLRRLLDYIEKDEQFPMEGLEKKTVTEVTTVLANHLFGQLATSSYYTIDKNCAAKRKIDQCLCGKAGCKLTGVFGDTSIGNPEVWHGNLDTIINDDLAVEPVADYPDSPGDNSPDEVKSTDLPENEQIIAKTVVFSFLQKRRHPEKANFLTPCIGVGSSEMVVMFYDSEHDVLLESSRISLMDSFFGKEVSKISIVAVLVSWLVVNHKYLCSGLKEDMKEYKADFVSHAERKMEVYTKHLQLGNVDDSALVIKNLRSDNPPKRSQHLTDVLKATFDILQNLQRNENPGTNKD